jgi:hypothetical protein
MSFKKLDKQKYVDVVAFLLLSFFLLFFYLMIFFEMENVIFKFIFFLGLFFLITGIAMEKKIFKHKRYEITKKVGVLIGVPLAAITTFLLSVQVNFGPVIASAAVGLSYVLVASHLGKSWKGLSAPIYCGSFVGMSSPIIFTELWMVGLAGFLASIMFIITEETYKGIGGKLGTIGFVGSTTVKKIILALLGR